MEFRVDGFRVQRHELRVAWVVIYVVDISTQASLPQVDTQRSGAVAKCYRNSFFSVGRAVESYIEEVDSRSSGVCMRGPEL